MRRSVETLESQVSDLQNEASRLMRSLESQKEQFDKERIDLRKSVEVLEKEQMTKEAELASLRDKMRQYQDYDELKRELEIMKVRGRPRLTCATCIDQYVPPSMSNLPAWISTPTKRAITMVRAMTVSSACRIRMPTRRTCTEASHSRISSWQRTASCKTRSRRSGSHTTSSP